MMVKFVKKEGLDGQIVDLQKMPRMFLSLAIACFWNVGGPYPCDVVLQFMLKRTQISLDCANLTQL